MGTYFFASFYPGNEQKACLWQLASAFFIHFNFFPFFTTAPFFWDIATLKRQQHTRGKKNYQALKWVKKPKRLQGSTMEIWCEKKCHNEMMPWWWGSWVRLRKIQLWWFHDLTKKDGPLCKPFGTKMAEIAGHPQTLLDCPCQDSMLWTKNGACRHGNRKNSPHMC